MIAQQARIVCRSGLLVVLVVCLAACSGTPERQTASRSEPVRAPAIGETAAQIALRQVGTPYRYGGQSPAGFDCSGLVHYSYFHAGKSVPRTTAQLWSGTEVIDKSDVRVGDVLFFSIEGKMSHVGMYVGEGRFVHAPSSGRTVSVESLSSPFYRHAFLRAGRPR